MKLMSLVPIGLTLMTSHFFFRSANDFRGSLVPIRACKLWHPRKPNLYDLQGTIGAVIGAVIGTKRRREPMEQNSVTKCSLIHILQKSSSSASELAG